ncbi:predicted protein [Naegleria gruberi]|uniref:Predicted protein n=1 Tax=Naegleria gruberi TaxID=5762 RepID=D2V216_NAEGR|nr:uncharacterized protein NAEGRDRAFT_62845 [Naegleria gruberi]EFC48824.1 predicted protein [Naegleria gruberi]|eukprot:XP_002681568.1 predicted protein [Naegleria gruberi strain NEG-M]
MCGIGFYDSQCILSSSSLELLNNNNLIHSDDEDEDRVGNNDELNNKSNSSLSLSNSNDDNNDENWNEIENKIGKRSLVYYYSNGKLIISSNSIPGMEFKSIPPFIFQLKNNQLKKYEYKSNFINKERILFKELQDLHSEEYKNVLNDFYRIFSDSISKRINFLQRPKLTNLENTKNGSENNLNDIENEANYAILFSGGIDSLVLASLSHLNSLNNLNEKITLLNVSFGNSLEQVSKGHDRIQSIQAFKMLNDKYGNRFNLVLIDVLKAQVEEYANTIKQLIYPNNTVLDYTIGCVLWFASRGRGYLYGSDTSQLVQSQSRVLLCGVGSDELLGGYRRYLKRFKDEGWEDCGIEIWEGMIELLHHMEESVDIHSWMRI